MRYAIFSDIQGNRQAWEAVREDMERQQVQMRVCLGDVVGGGPTPLEVLRGIRAATGNIIMGNQDAAVVGLLDEGALESGIGEATKRTRGALDQEALDFLAKRPLAIKTEQLLFTHAEAVQASRFGCIDSVEAARANFAPSDHQVTFVGHGHRPAVFVMHEDGTVEEQPARDCQLAAGNRYLVNVGSVGEPAQADGIRARYVVYDDSTQDLSFRCVPFDAEACRREWTAAGLPLPAWLSPAEAGPPTVRPRLVVTAGAVGSGAPPGGAGSVTPQAPSVAPTPVPVMPSSPPRRRKWVVVTLLSVVAVLAVGLFVVAGVMVTIKLRGGGTKPEPLADISEKPVTEPAAQDAPGSPQEEKAGEDAGDTGIVATDPAPADAPPQPEPEPQPEPKPAPPEVAVVPASQPAPPEPAPKPPPLPPGPPPLPPEPENAAAATPLGMGLLFYAPLDEAENEFTARDLVGGRGLDITGGLPGVMGRVGMAVALEKQNGCDALVSPAKPLPEMKAITISFWIKRPDPPLADDPDPSPEGTPGDTGKKPLPVEPPMNLVSLKGFCGVRLEKNQVVADLDLKGEAARLDFPQDFRWHHVLVENGEGSTSIWIDHRSQSTAVSEKLNAPPAAGVAVQIGSKGAHIHVDEVAVWNRKFTMVERQILYRNGRLDTPVLSPPKAVAHWRFDDKALSRRFIDTAGSHALGAYKAWTPLAAIAPNPVPGTKEPNFQAAQLWQVSERPTDAGSFQMKADASFTYEGWMKPGAGSVVFLGGIAPGTDEEPRGGWRLETRPGKGVKGFMAFTFERGSVKAQGIGGDLPIYDGRAHHFAVVWNALATPTHGAMEVYLNNKMVATATLALSDVGTPSEAPFRIAASKNPVILDEVRFTAGALKPPEFLTSGLAPAASGEVAAETEKPPEGETPMERRAREARERRERANAKREEKRREEEAKRNRNR